MSYGLRGMLVGALVGLLAAWSQWEGSVGAVIRVVVVVAAIGFVVGHYIGKRRTA